MKLKIILQIAWGLLKARKRQTIVAAVGVTFGITTFITLLGFMNGLNDLLDGLMMNRTPHIRLYNEITPSVTQPIDEMTGTDKQHNFVKSIKPKNDRIQIRNSQPILNYLRQVPEIKGVTTRITSQVFFNIGGSAFGGLINGVDVAREKELFFFEDYMVKGNSMDLQNVSNSIILGKMLAEKLMVRIGDLVQVTAPNGERFQLKVVGLFQTGIADIDKSQSYAAVQTTQKILNKTSDYVTDILIKLNDVKKAPALSRYYAELFHVSSIDMNTANAQFDTGSSIRSLISYSVGITLLVIAGFGIYNILNMLIYEKMDSIAILKATGFSGRDVSRIFITIALVIGVAGGGLGLLLGNLLCHLIHSIPFNTDALPTIETYPIDFSTKYYVIAAIFSVVTTYFAGYFPSRKASKVDPVAIIRGK